MTFIVMALLFISFLCGILFVQDTDNEMDDSVIIEVKMLLGIY